jgi:putative component of membrane protein insertase Oxa1/YidC/SpoIIIJ protein YidD
MKIILISIIKIYWKFIPANKRRHCIFNESCSKHIYRIVNEDGVKQGLKALIDRFKKCRPNYKVYYNSSTRSVEVELEDHTVVQPGVIRPGLIKKYLDYKE